MIKGLLAGAVSVAAMMTATSANAAVVFNISQVGNDVVISASGIFDRSLGATNRVSTNNSTGVFGNGAFLGIGGVPATNPADRYDTSTIQNFGTSANYIGQDSGSSLFIGFAGFSRVFYLDSSYVSNSIINSTGLYRNRTIASLALSEGAYNFTAGGNAVTLNVGQMAGAVPEPATWAMMTLGFGGMGYAMRRKAKVGTRVRFA